jgi:hypothetical protein
MDPLLPPVRSLLSLWKTLSLSKTLDPFDFVIFSLSSPFSTGLPFLPVTAAEPLDGNRRLERPGIKQPLELERKAWR